MSQSSSPEEKEVSLLDLLSGESRSESPPPPSSGPALVPTAALTPRFERFGSSDASMGPRPADLSRQEVDYHVWQNLNTGEYSVRPVLRSGQTHEGPKLSSLQRGSRSGDGFQPEKKERISWTGDLQRAFEDAVDELGKAATPKPIMKILQKRGFVHVSREHVSSHLQKHKNKRLSLESLVRGGQDPPSSPKGTG